MFSYSLAVLIVKDGIFFKKFFGSYLARQLDSQDLANPSSQTSSNALWPNTKTSNQSVSCEELAAGTGMV